MSDHYTRQKLRSLDRDVVRTFEVFVAPEITEFVDEYHASSVAIQRAAARCSKDRNRVLDETRAWYRRLRKRKNKRKRMAERRKSTPDGERHPVFLWRVRRAA